MKFNNSIMLLSVAATAAILTGCGQQNSVTVRQVPKEPTAASSQSAAMAAAHGHGDIQGTPSSNWEVTYKLPDGWQQGKADQMRAARLSIPAKDEFDVDISIIPMPGITAPKEDIINIWREQLKLKAVSADEVSKLAQPVTIGSGNGELYDMVSESPVMTNHTFNLRIVAGILKENDVTWFAKMTGPDALVSANKEIYKDFLKTVAFKVSTNKPAAGSAMGGMGMGMGGAMANIHKSAGNKPEWQAPADWKEAPAGMMQVGKFTVSGTGDEQAEVTVSNLGGDGGGTLANVNRWRGQLQLAPIEEADLSKNVTSIKMGATTAIMTDIKGGKIPTSGKPARMVVMAVPVGEKTWYYKLVGDDAAVEKQKDAFNKFVQSVKYTNASH